MSLFAPATTFRAIAEVMPRLSYRWTRASAGRLEHLCNRLLADLCRLPGPRHVVPDVIRIEAPQNIARPGSYQAWTLHCDPHDVPPAPVMPHEIDRLWQLRRVRRRASRDKRRWNSQSRKGLRSQIRVETDERHHRRADAGRDRPRSPRFQDFREQEQSSSKLFPEQHCTCLGAERRIQGIECIASTSARKAASRRFLLGGDLPSVTSHHGTESIDSSCCLSAYR